MSRREIFSSLVASMFFVLGMIMADSIFNYMDSSPHKYVKVDDK